MNIHEHQAKELLQQFGVAVLPGGVACTADEAEAVLERLGGPIHAPIGHFTGTGPTESELAFGADAHRNLAERAQAEGMYLSLEPLNRFETYFLNTMAQAKAYVDRVGHPALRLMYDTFHANIEERSQIRAIASVAGHIGVLHVSENDRGIPGRGHIDFASIFRMAPAKSRSGSTARWSGGDASRGSRDGCTPRPARPCCPARRTGRWP